MTIGVSSYSFSQLLQSGRQTQLGLLALAKEMGFDSLEFTDLTPPAGQSEADFARQLRDESARVGLPIASYTVEADFLRCADKEAEVARVCQKAEVARLLGAPLLRHDATRGWPLPQAARKGFEAALPLLAAACRQVAGYAAAQGVVTTVENHGYFCQESARVTRLAEAVDHENFGLLVDVGNFLCADEPPAAAVGRAAPFARHVHVKDFLHKPGSQPNPGAGWFATRGGDWLRGTAPGRGVVPLGQCLRVLAAAGYAGVVSVEFEGPEDCREALSGGLRFLRGLLAAEGLSPA